MNIEELRIKYAEFLINSGQVNSEVLAFEYLCKDFENYSDSQLIREIKESAPDLLKGN